MPNPPKYAFAFTARTTDGKSVTDRINADSEQSALSTLRDTGYADIQLLDTEDSAIKLDQEASRRRLIFSAQEERDLRQRRGLIDRLAWAFAKNSVIWGPLSIWLAWSIWHNGAFSAPALWPASALGLHLIWFLWVSVPGIIYHRALEASVWSRWHEVFRLMQMLDLWKRWFKTPMPQHEIVFRSATAEAGMGRLDAALARVAPLKHDPGLRPGFFAARCASLYMVAREFQRMAVLQHQAREQNPSSAATIDLAMTLARWLGNMRGATKLLDEVDAAQLPPAAQAFVYMTRGIIALDGGDAATALEFLNRALEIVRIEPGTALMQGIVFDCRAHCGLALVALGDHAGAAIEFAATRPFLESRRDQQMIDRCDRALSIDRRG